MELIPGLPDDIAIECLIRVPFSQISKAASVSKDWKSKIQQPEFWQQRKAAGLTRPLVAMTQARVNPNQNDHGAKHLNYQLKICDPEQGFWYEVPPIPGFSEGLPMFCQVVGVGINLVVMGGFDPVSWKTLNSVFIYDLLTATWRVGADLPGGQRSFFGCASDRNRTVLVAGGHDGNKNALRSAMTYDVEKDEWVILPDMARERDECKCIFYRGGFHVIGGYCTERQGDFQKSAEALDVDTWKWDPVDDFLPDATCSGYCVSSSDQQLYMFLEGDVFQFENTTWKTLARLSANVREGMCLTAGQTKIFVSGLTVSCGSTGMYVIGLVNRAKTKIEVPHEHSGHVQSVCYLEI